MIYQLWSGYDGETSRFFETWKTVAARVRIIPPARGNSAQTVSGVRPEGAYHLWRKVPSRQLSIDLEADEPLGWVTGRVEAS